MKAMVLCSGGVDSTTCLGIAVDKYGAENVVALSIYYGQRHTKEIESADKVTEYYGVEHISLILKRYSSIVIVHCLHILIKRYQRSLMQNRLKRLTEVLCQLMFRFAMACSFQVRQA